MRANRATSCPAARRYVAERSGSPVSSRDGLAVHVVQIGQFGASRR